MIRTERNPSADSWFHGGQDPDEEHDPYGVHDCIKPKVKPPSPGVVIDFLRDAEGIPITGPDGEPWFVELATTIQPKKV